MKSFKFINQSIKTKLAIIIIATSFTAIVIALSLYFSFDMAKLKNDLRETALLNANLIGEYSAAPLLFGFAEEANDILSKLETNPAITDALIYEDDPSTIFASYHKNSESPCRVPDLKNKTTLFKDRSLHVLQTITYKEKKCGYIYLKLSSDSVNKSLIMNLTIMGIIIFLMFFIILTIANRLQKLISEPIVTLAMRTQDIGKNQDYSMKLSYPVKDEIGNLYSHFNNMLEQISKRQSERDQAENNLKEANERLYEELQERMQMEASLRSSEERYRHLFEHNPASMLIYERSSLKILASNEAFTKHYGYSDEDMHSMLLQDLYPTKEKAPIMELTKTMKGYSSAGEWHHIKKNGSLITIIAVSHDIEYEGKEARIAVITDITKRKKVEEEIAFLAEVLRNINEYVSITDTNNIITFVNHAWLSNFGYTEKEVLGKNIEMIVSDSNKKGILDEILADTLNGGWQGELDNTRKDGSVFPVQLVTTIIYDSDGRPSSLVGISSDISERKRVREELKLHRDHLQELVIQRTAELEKEKENALSADRLKSAFLATMSHELRTPLNSIIGFTGILLKEYPGPLNKEQKKQLGMAQGSARHLLSLINDVLDISKIEAGQLTMNLESFNLSDTINKVVETTRPFAEKKNLELIVTIDKDINEITSDSLRVQQILLNLVNNAIKFTETGTIDIRSYIIDNFVKIEVIDSGIGIEKEKMKNLFQPFTQIDSGLTRKHEGTGLGLSICKKLTEMLNGTISVKSIFGSGSTFAVTLPLN